MGEDLHSLAAQIVSAAENHNYDGEVEDDDDDDDGDGNDNDNDNDDDCDDDDDYDDNYDGEVKGFLKNKLFDFLGGRLEQGLVFPQRPALHYNHHDHHRIWTHFATDRLRQTLHHPLCNGG